MSIKELSNPELKRTSQNAALTAQLYVHNTGDIMTYFLITFVVMLIVIAIMAIGVIFGRRAIKGSCGGGMSKAECVCVEKCDKRKKMEADAHLTQG